MIKHKIEIVFLLGGGIVKNKRGFWQTPGYNAGDRFGVSGAKLRVLAAAYLYRQKPSRVIISSGQKAWPDAPRIVPSVAEVMRGELIKLGVSQKQILIDERSFSSYRQLLALRQIIRRKSVDKVLLISNDYHLPRLKVMIKCFPALKLLKNSKKIVFVSAEKIMLKSDKQKWKSKITASYHSPAMRTRMRMERKGVRDILSGNYHL